jgi:hypothetical protein
VYCDNDPVVLAHARALLTSNPAGACAYVDADVRDPATILGQAAQTLDFSQPVAILLLALLHFLRDADNPAGVVTALADGLAPGSFVAISHLTADFAPEQVGSGVHAYNALSPAAVIPRTHAQVSALFGGLSLVAPGVVTVTEWRADNSPVGQIVDLYAGLARVPCARR